MGNRIDEAFSRKKKLKIMTHVLAGYPDRETSKRLVLAMARAGADMIEIQIPFSDPIADGPTIMAANQKSLENGMTPNSCLAMVRELKNDVRIPLLFMSYTNIAYHMGMEKFISASAECGASGLIIPDLPFDERNFNYLSLVKKYNIHGIQVLSAGMTASRLRKILKIAEGFLYITLRVGITGVRRAIGQGSFSFINRVKSQTRIPVAAGFGISSADHMRELRGRVEMAVIGSHLIELFNSGGIESVQEFIEECNRAIEKP
jgi:tryptophan synthase alpha chain